MNKKPLERKFAIVTGASTGIGRAIALELAIHGSFVALVARRKEKLEQTKKLIENAGGKAIIFPADLSRLESINKLIDEIKKVAKKVNILVNVAGIWHGKDDVYAGKNFEEFGQKVILDTYSVGLITPTLLSHAFITLMPKGSKIINISGTFESGAKGWIPYFVSKRSIEDLTVGLAQELKEKGIQVNAVSPSDTKTEEYKKYFPEYLNEALEPKTIAEEVLNLLNKNVSGKVIVVKNNHKPFEGFHF